MRSVALALSVFIASAHAAPVEGPKLAASGVSFVNLSREAGDVLIQKLSVAFKATGVRIVTPHDLIALLSVERQRQILGCEGSTTCLAELTGALGVDAVLSGSLGKFGNTYQLSLSAVSNSGALLSSFSGRAEGDGELEALFAHAAHEMSPEIGDGLHKPVERWGHNTISGGALGWALRQFRVEYERVLDDKTSIYVAPELDLRQPQLNNFPVTNGAQSDSLLLTIGVHNYWRGGAPGGFSWSAALQIQSAFSFSNQLAEGIIGIYALGEIRYSWLFWSSFVLSPSLAAGVGGLQELSPTGISYSAKVVTEFDLMLGYRF